MLKFNDSVYVVRARCNIDTARLSDFHMHQYVGRKVTVKVWVLSRTKVYKLTDNRPLGNDYLETEYIENKMGIRRIIKSNPYTFHYGTFNDSLSKALNFIIIDIKCKLFIANRGQAITCSGGYPSLNNAFVQPMRPFDVIYKQKILHYDGFALVSFREHLALYRKTNEDFDIERCRCSQCNRFNNCNICIYCTTDADSIVRSYWCGSIRSTYLFHSFIPYNKKSSFEDEYLIVDGEVAHISKYYSFFPEDKDIVFYDYMILWDLVD